MLFHLITSILHGRNHRNLKYKGNFIMVKPLGVQLYSVREYAKEDFVKVLKKTAEIGYKVVEPAGFFDLTPAEFKKSSTTWALRSTQATAPGLTPLMM